VQRRSVPKARHAEVSIMKLTPHQRTTVVKYARETTATVQDIAKAVRGDHAAVFDVVTSTRREMGR
jgi:hypothetical protein